MSAPQECKAERFVFVIKETALMSIGALYLLRLLLFAADVGCQEDHADEQPETHLDPVLDFDGINKGQGEEKHEDGKSRAWFDFFHGVTSL